MPGFGGLCTPRQGNYDAIAATGGGGCMKKATGLGRGLSALIGEAPPVPRSGSMTPGGIKMIEVALIRPNPSQPRQVFDEVAINELAASIGERGVLQPIILRA